MMSLESYEICPFCDSENLEKQKSTFEFVYKEHKKKIEIDVFYCSVCGEEVLPLEVERQLDKEYADFRREVDGLLLSTDILRIREKYHLTQEKLSQLMGLSPKTIAKYENGFSIQSKCADKFLRTIDSLPEAVALLKDKLSTSNTQCKSNVLYLHEYTNYNLKYEKENYDGSDKEVSTEDIEYIL